MANSNHNDNGTPPSNNPGGTETRKKSWIVWLMLAIGIVIALFALKRCSGSGDVARVDSASAVSPAAPAISPATPASVAAADAILVPNGTSRIGVYLAGTEALPRTFVFEKLNFDTSKSDIRPADREELNMLAAALKQHPNARLRIVGYADARGAAASNATLGKERAESVKAALVADGIDAGRLETASGGEANPVDTNATSAGQAENRRTELVILGR